MQVVHDQNMQDKLKEDFDPIDPLLLVECETKKLINECERQEIWKMAQWSNDEAVSKLLYFMEEKGNDGYRRFKDVLCKRSTESRVFEFLCKDINAMENEVHNRAAAKKVCQTRYVRYCAQFKTFDYFFAVD